MTGPQHELFREDAAAYLLGALADDERMAYERHMEECPECRHEVVTKADLVGSTEFIIKTVEAAPPGTSWAIGTELNLVQRLANAHPEQHIAFLDKTVCYCSTMNRIDLPHLVWALESLVDGRVVNTIRVEEQVAADARAALDQMLALPGETSRD